jgi:hypothetical protein
MDKYDIMSLLSDLFMGLESDEDINAMVKEIVKIAGETGEMSKQYLKEGIL